MVDTDTAILIAAYNAEATLEQALASALAQPEAVEVCVIDDASSDRTAQIAQGWAARDRRVRLLRQETNAGPAAARNAGLAATHAPWVGVLDADDFLLEGRLSRLLEHAAEGDFVADVLIRTTSRIPPALPSPARVTSNYLTFETFLTGNLGSLKGPLDLGFLKPVFRRSFLERHGLRYATNMRLGEDYEFFARALALGARFVVLPPVGYVSVEREGSLSRHHSEEDLRLLRDCDDGLAKVRPLTPSEARALKRHWTSVDCRLQWRRLISAVKARDLRAALGTFHTPSAALFLAARLAEQVWLRSAAALRPAARAR